MPRPYYITILLLTHCFHGLFELQFGKGISRTFVLTGSENPSTILGYFALTLCEVKTEHLPAVYAGKFPEHGRLFERAGFAVIPFASDYRVCRRHTATILDFLPCGKGLEMTEMGLREVYGYLYYWLTSEFYRSEKK